MFQYIAFHKPYGVLSQFTPEAGHQSLADFDLPKEVYPAGRLDHDSEGLLLLTNDGGFIKKLLDPKFAHPRTYWVQVDGQITNEAINQLKKGVVIKGYKTKPCQVKALAEPDDLPERNPPIRYRKNIPTSWIEITLTEGKNRQVRRMTASVRFPTLRLIRVAIGHLCLKDLKQGHFKSIQKNDIL